MIGIIVVLASWYVVAAVAYWLIARHYCRPFRLLSFRDLWESWQLFDELGVRRAWGIRLAIVAAVVGSLVLAWGMS
jgi:hypothetical protein